MWLDEGKTVNLQATGVFSLEKIRFLLSFYDFIHNKKPALESAGHHSGSKCVCEIPDVYKTHVAGNLKTGNLGEREKHQVISAISEAVFCLFLFGVLTALL